MSSEDLISAIGKATKKWTAAKRKEARTGRMAYEYQYSSRVTIREVALEVMEEAYNHASDNGRLWTTARQVMYAARPHILKRATLKGDKLNSRYFQEVLKDYIEMHNPGWRIAWDARGHFIEPYTGESIDLGSLEVIKYIESWYNEGVKTLVPRVERNVGTCGPHHRFKSVLFTEKEGFHQNLFESGLLQKYDMGLISMKGVPVAAGCDLISKLESMGVQCYCIRDFDKYGYVIANSLKEGVRLSQGSNIIDLGLRLSDVQTLGLDHEPVSYRSNPSWLFREYGATQEEIDFLVQGKWPHYKGFRVELNAMTSQQILDWLEAKFIEHGVTKYTPDKETLDEAYRRASILKPLQKEIDAIDLEDSEDPPEDLEKLVSDYLKEHPEVSWDQAVWRIQ